MYISALAIYAWNIFVSSFSWIFSKHQNISAKTKHNILYLGRSIMRGMLHYTHFLWTARKFVGNVYGFWYNIYFIICVAFLETVFWFYIRISVSEELAAMQISSSACSRSDERKKKSLPLYYIFDTQTFFYTTFNGAFFVPPVNFFMSEFYDILFFWRTWLRGTFERFEFAGQRIISFTTSFFLVKLVQAKFSEESIKVVFILSGASICKFRVE